MTDTKISGLTPVTQNASGDLVPVVDVSDTAQGAGGSTRKITIDNFKDYRLCATGLYLPSGVTPATEDEWAWNPTRKMGQVHDGKLVGSVPTVPKHARSGGDTVTASVVNTTETNHATKLTLPANFWIVGRTLRVIELAQVTTSASPPQFTHRLKFGTTNLITHTGQTPGGNNTARPSGRQHIITCVATGASGSVEVSSFGWGLSPLNISFLGNEGTPVTIDTTAQADLQFSTQFDTNTAGNNIDIRQLIVEMLN